MSEKNIPPVNPEDQEALALANVETLKRIEQLMPSKKGMELVEFMAVIVSAFKGQKGEKGDKGDDGKDGKDGKDADEVKVFEAVWEKVKEQVPILDDLLEAVKPFLEPGPQGEPGKDADPKEVAEALKNDAEFVEKARGPEGKEGKQGKPGKSGTPETAEEIIAKINASESQIEAARIVGLFRPSTGGPGPASKTYSLIEMDDVDFDGGAPEAGDVLTFGENGKWGFAPGGSASFADNETPTGAINDVNTVFTLAHTPVAGSLAVYLNGARQQGAGGDYTLSGDEITFNSAPLTGSVLTVDYRYNA